MQSLLALLDSLESRLVLGQPPPDSAGLLGAEVERQVLLVFVEDAELLALSGIDDSQDTGDRLADIVTVNPYISYLYPPMFSFPSRISEPLVEGGYVHLGELGGSTTGDFLDTEVGKLQLQLIELLLQVGLGLLPEGSCLDTGLNCKGKIEFH